MEDLSTDKRPVGCGLFNAVFRKTKFQPRRSASTSALSVKPTLNSSHNPKRRRNSFHDNAFVEEGPSTTTTTTTTNTTPNGHRQNLPKSQQTSIIKPKSGGKEKSVVVAGTGGRSNLQQGVIKETIGISGELENIIADHQRLKGGNANLVRASSGNVMLYGHLGNLRQPDTAKPPPPSNSNAKSNKNPRDEAPPHNPNGAANTRYANSVMGNIVKNNNSMMKQKERSSGGGNSLCRALSCRMDPEQLKILGNEDYKNGRFAEALALYERAIDTEPSKASYRSNKSAALTALGRLLEAVFECREAIRIEPHYHRAHHRLANLYLRLGEADKSLYHFKQAGPEADPDAMAKAKEVMIHLKKCDQAKRIRDWNNLIKETGSAISAGADSAPLMFAMQAEAFLKLNRHQDAETALRSGPCFDIDQRTKFFGAAGNAALLLIRAQVDMACGRFEDAVVAAERASELDPCNRDVKPIIRRVRAISSARANGNDLFKSSRFSEASTAYSQGLEHDPCNSVLLCNRAACRSKLGQYDKAVEDCSAALKVRPSYSKARRRRADCNSKLGKWEMAVQDYEMLMTESNGDEEVERAVFEARIQLKKQRGEDVTCIKFGDN